MKKTVIRLVRESHSGIFVFLVEILADYQFTYMFYKQIEKVQARSKHIIVIFKCILLLSSTLQLFLIVEVLLSVRQIDVQISSCTYLWNTLKKSRPRTCSCVYYQTIFPSKSLLGRCSSSPVGTCTRSRRLEVINCALNELLFVHCGHREGL